MAVQHAPQDPMRLPGNSPAIPASAETLEGLRVRVDALVAERAVISAEATADAVEGIPRPDARLLARRIAALRGVIDRVRVAEPHGMAMLGSQIVVCHPDGSRDVVKLVTSDDAPAGRISIESPFSRALLGRSAGERVEFEAPAGRRTMTIAELR